MRAAVITAIFGGYERLKPVCEQDIDVEWILVTDDAALASGMDDRYGWTVVYEDRHGEHPNRAAKPAKIRPWRYTTAPCSVWIDGSFQVRSSTFVRDVLAVADPVAQFGHPWRDCIYEEADETLAIHHKAKYGCERVNVEAQTARYRELGHPEHWGLWAAGVIARHHTRDVRHMGDLWQAEIDRWSFQDQISEPVALRHAGLRPSLLDGTHLANGWLQFAPSDLHLQDMAP